MNNVQFRKSVGDHSTFAVEFDLRQNFSGKWNDWWGCFWLWVDGRVVGNPAEIEMIIIALGSLMSTAEETGMRPSSLVPADSPKEMLEAVMWARYGEDDIRMSSLIPNVEQLYPFEVLPGSTGPFFDNWEAVLVEQGDTEHFIFRERDKEVVEVIWPLGTFRDVVSRASLEFESLKR
jgi:hypothetical protein